MYEGFTLRSQAVIAPEIRNTAFLFKYLADPARLKLLCLLAAEGEMFVGQISERMGYTQPAISSQLRWLRVCELVEVRRDGPKLFYSLMGGFEGVVRRLQTAVDSIRPVSPKVAGEKR
jgi:DNA-binding transcriptional ArsR family regulator